MKISQKIIISGIILPQNWDENGRATEIAVYTNTEEVYAVKHSSLTPELLSLIQKGVEIRGKIIEHPDGKKYLAVINYIVLEQTYDDET
jgi:hypothetical protein